jgi:hypothetical protein
MSWTKWNGNVLIRMTNHAINKSLLETAEAIGAIADQQVPHDEGMLQQSKTIKVNPADLSEVSISYGGGTGTGFPRIPYAVKWHETQANFQKNRKWKYLRDPVFNNGSAIMMDKMRRNLRAVW